MLELCAGEEEAEEPVELVAPLEPVVLDVAAPDCAAAAACVSAASRLENKFVPDDARPAGAGEDCALPAPVAPAERCGGEYSPIRWLKPEIPWVDIM